MPKKPLIKYTSRDFDSIKTDLVEHAKRYYPNSYNDFSDSSFGGLVMDSVAYVGDILSFYLDFQTNESFLETSLDLNNIRRIASQMGYNYYGNPSSYGMATLFVLIPAATTGLGPDTRFIPVIKSGTKIRSDSATFTLTENVDFNDPSVEIVAARFDENTGKPTQYALRTFGQVKSGVEFYKEIDVGNQVKFLRVRVSTAAVNEIISVFDTEGHQYYQVENLSQEVVYMEQSNPNVTSDGVRSILKPFIASRRFVVEQDQTGTYLQFGYGSETQIDKFGITDPSQVVLKMSGKNHVTDTAFDPNQFLGTDKFAIQFLGSLKEPTSIIRAGFNLFFNTIGRIRSSLTICSAKSLSYFTLVEPLEVACAAVPTWKPMSLVPLPTTSAESKSVFVKWKTRDAGSSGLYPFRNDFVAVRKVLPAASPIIGTIPKTPAVASIPAPT